MYRCLSLCFIVLVCIGCKSNPAYQQVDGKTMGTTYSIKANMMGQLQQSKIDSILIAINESVSTYIPSSDISRFNTSSDGINMSLLKGDHFLQNLDKAIQISALTSGAFDPTVMPLVNYWGFGTTGKKTLTSVDSSAIQDLLTTMGFDKVKRTTTMVSKTIPSVQLDFSAIAKGYAVDVLCSYLESVGVTDYYVEIGGELRTKGVNPRKTPWTLGINLPERTAAMSDVITYMQLSGQAMATSGNYRNYYEIEGKYYGHTIDPHTGYPVSDILSATIITEDCMTADALATACMVMGLDKSLDIIKSSNNTEGLFVYSREDGNLAIEQTKGISKYRME